MYARLVLFTLGPGNWAKAESIASDLAPRIRAQDGCESVTFFGDDSDGQCGLFVLWDSQESADAAAAVISPQLRSALEGNVQTPPSIRLYRVIDESP